jgi:type VII secretion-associated serine protease mycosin
VRVARRRAGRRPGLTARLLPALLAAFTAASVCAPVAHADPGQVRRAQWHLDDLRLPAAWEISRGKGVTIAILDTGVEPRDHSLRGRVTSGPDVTTSGAKRGSRLWGRHGTAMATVAAGSGPTSAAPDAILGVAPEARILSLRVILEREDPEFKKRDSSHVAEAIRYAVAHGAGVINMSFGGEDLQAAGSASERAAVRYALARGVVLVASAGNGGDPHGREDKHNAADYPAGYAGVIAVGASRRDHTPAVFSTRHTYVTVAAPGERVVEKVEGQRYWWADGTSPAAAIVSGTVALIKSKYPRLRPAQVRQVLVGSASHRPPGGHDAALGFGIVNPLGALRAAAKLASAPAAGARPNGVPRYFGPGPGQPASPSSPAGIELRRGQRLLLGGLGVAFLVPAFWLLTARGRNRDRATHRERARRRPGRPHGGRRPTGDAAGGDTPGAAGTPGPSPPAGLARDVPAWLAEAWHQQRPDQQRPDRQEPPGT